MRTRVRAVLILSGCIFGAASAQAESIEKVNRAIAAGGESYFRYRQIEMIPIIAPRIADALAQARLITVSGNEDGGAPNGATNQIASVIQTVLAAQLVSRGGMLGEGGGTVLERESTNGPTPPVTAPAKTVVNPGVGLPPGLKR